LHDCVKYAKYLYPKLAVAIDS